jgi:signal transduction histidine kinase
MARTKREAAELGELMAKIAESERQLRILRAELELSQKLATLGTIAAMVAHEVNNLMTPVLTYAQLAQAHPDDPDLVAKALARAAAGAQQASKIATSILSLARPESETRRECDVAAVIAEAVECVPRGTLRATQIVVEAPPGLWAAMGPVAFQQVVLNLVLNAVRAMGGQSGRVAVRAAADIGGVRLAVEDEGPGVSPEIAGDLFEPFRTAAGGNGLGLAICRRLVTEAGGEIWLDRDFERGARFCVRVPRVKAAVAA